MIFSSVFSAIFSVWPQFIDLSISIHFASLAIECDSSYYIMPLVGLPYTLQQGNCLCFAVYSSQKRSNLIYIFFCITLYEKT